ncbi:MAG: hypothetical protein NC218_01610 [Acetobacter sp.]|nr:hypothetical protein [Acetobacter sp.]
MANKRKSATEPIQDDATFAHAELIEEELAPVQGGQQLTPEEEAVVMASLAGVGGAVPPMPQAQKKPAEQEGQTVEEPVVSERVLTAEERKLEVQLILAGIQANREALLKDAEARVTKVQEELKKSLEQFDKLTLQYSEELTELRKEEGAQK